MRYVTLAALAVAALLALVGAGTASATVLCSTKTNPCTSKWPVNTVTAAKLREGSTTKVVDTEGESINSCTGSTTEGKVTNAGSSTTTVVQSVESLTWSGCTFSTTVLTKGSIEVHSIPGTHNGTVTAAGETRNTINSIFFGSCIYGVTAGTHLGVTKEGGTFIGSSVAEKMSGSSLACPSTSVWSAEYVQVKPSGTSLYIEPS